MSQSIISENSFSGTQTVLFEGLLARLRKVENCLGQYQQHGCQKIVTKPAASFSSAQHAMFEDLLTRLRNVEAYLRESPSSRCSAPVTSECKIGATYEKAFFYEAGKYHDWMIDQLLASLKLDHHHGSATRFVDIGGGTGHIAVSLTERAGLDPRCITVVEPSESMASQAIARKLHTEVVDAFSWALSSSHHNNTTESNDDELSYYDRMLLKEMIHLVSADKRRSMWHALFKKLSPGGVVCIVTRPKDNIDYPFFEAAHEVWRNQCSPISELVEDLTNAGFTNIDVKLHAYPCRIEVDRWLGMIRNKFWSTFESFDDKSLELGCTEIRERFKEQAVIEFEDRIHFVTAVRPN
jgi:SAM-dependent methyltransferase